MALFVERGEQAQQQLGNLDDLAKRAAGRLDTMTLEERKEVLALLDVRVYVLDQSKSPALRITGTVADIGNAASGQQSSGTGRIPPASGLSPNTDGGQRWLSPSESDAFGAAKLDPCILAAGFLLRLA